MEWGFSRTSAYDILLFYYFFPDACAAVNVPTPRAQRSIATMEAILPTGVSFIASHMIPVRELHIPIVLRKRFAVSMPTAHRSPSRSFSPPVIQENVDLYTP